MAYDSIFTSNSSSNRKVKRSKKNYLLFPIILALAIIPLIVHQYTFDNTLSSYSWFINEEKSNEFFLGYKSILLTINGFIMLSILAYHLIAKKITITVRAWTISIIVYSLFVLLSTIFSNYRSTALNGGYEHFETMWVLLSYCLLLYYSYTFTRNEKDLIVLVKFLLASAFIIGLLGSLQALGLDFFRSTIGKLLISNSSEWRNLDEFVFSFEKGRVYSTLFNPNYVGVYTSLIVPMTLGYAILSENKKQKIISLVTSSLLIIATFGSQSRTSLMTLIITTVLLILLLRKKIVRNSKIFMISIGVMIGLFVIVNVLQDNAYWDRIKSVFTQQEQQIYVEQIETGEDQLKIVYNGKTLLIQCYINEDDSIACSVTDEQGNIYETQFDSDNSKFVLLDDVFQGMYITPVYLDEQYTFGFQVTMNNVDWLFKSPNEYSGYQYVNQFGRYTNIITFDSALFTKQGSMFSGRGYIWSRTIPLLKDSAFIGAGPDTFVYSFPQEDYVGKMNYGFQSQVITKPHNMYLQIFMQTGGISCLAFILLYIIYAIESLKTYAKSSFKTFVEKIGVLIFVGTIGYMISGLINDSTVTVAPVFWALLGIGFACNRLIRESKEKSNLVDGIN